MDIAEKVNSGSGLECAPSKYGIVVSAVSDDAMNKAPTQDKPFQAESVEGSLKPENSSEMGQSGVEAVPPSEKEIIKDENNNLVNGEVDNGTGGKALDMDAKLDKSKEKVAEIFDRLIGDESDASGDSADVKEEASNITYPGLRKRKPLSKRIPKAEKRMYQNLLYTTLVEDRLQHLETSLKEFQESTEKSLQRLQAGPGKPATEAQKESDSPATTSKEKEKPKDPSPEVAIRYLKWTEFEIKGAPRRKKEAKEEEEKKTGIAVIDDAKSTTPPSVLEVLIEEPQITIQRRFRGHKRLSNVMAEPSGSGPSPKSSKPDDSTIKGPQVPIRVRIRSPLLMKILGKITTKRLGDYDRNLVTFLRPFKLLVKFAEQIRQYLKDLEEKHRKKSPSTDDLTVDAAAKDQESEMGQQPASTTSPESASKEEPKKAEEEDELESYEALEHLRILVKLMDEDLKHIWDIRQKLKERTLRKIAFADLWLIFDHGQEVRTPESKGIQLYRVMAFTGGREAMNWTADPDDETPAKKVEDYAQGAFFLQCYHLDFNGAHYGPKDTFFTIRRYEGEKEINTLPCFPLACDPLQDRVRKDLLARGNQFAQLSTPNNSAHRHYSGLTIDRHQEQVDSQVIVDFQWAFLKNPDWKTELGFTSSFKHDGRDTTIREADLGTCGREGCCGNDLIHYDYEIDEMAHKTFEEDQKHTWAQTDSPEDLEDDDRVLLPNRAFGFVLRSRKWATFALESLGDVDYNDASGWSALELPKGHKETVLALVENHAGGPNSSVHRSDTFSKMDLIRGKGKGLIILLHGEPGVGKTSTAECVADHTRRPLFPITCGDIGENAETVEVNLENNFQLAHRWGCVLLLDEADVFLQKRDRTDLTRNAIVSVFLRTLEYYSGILFLTTNRVGTIDEAFRSRIHLSLLYPRLDPETTVKIWTNHIARIKSQLKKEEKKFEIDRNDIIKFAKAHYRSLKKEDMAPWNGRQIRNAFQTAMALAEYDAKADTTPKLSRVQFEKVAETSKQFDIYLKSVWGGRDDSFLAKRDQLRDDELMAADGGKLGVTVAKQMAPQRSPAAVGAATTATTATKGKKVATGKGVAPQVQEGEFSEHSSDEDEMEPEDEEEEENN